MTPEKTARIWTKRGFVDDRCTQANGAVFMAPSEATARLSPGRANILMLEPGDELASIAGRLNEFAGVVIGFPAFTDGRGFSTARSLREQHGYAGPIRATGHFLLDQIPLMLRTGFDEFAVTDPAVMARLADNTMPGSALHYQPALGAEEASGGRSWTRRKARSGQSVPAA